MTRLFSMTVILMLGLPLGGCRINPELHLREVADTRIVLETQVDVDVMWQVNWTTVWEYPWDEVKLGPVGYTIPNTMCLHVYPLDANNQIKSHIVHNFVGTSTELSITAGVHDLLFYNNDSEVLLFQSDEETGEVHCTTRQLSSGLKGSQHVLTALQKEAGMLKNEVDSLKPEAVRLTPDPLYTLYKPGFVVSDNPDDYEFIDGRYVLRVDGELEPATYIYLFQLALENNEGRVVGSNGGAALTGVADGVELKSRVAHTTTSTILADAYFDMGDNLMGARFVSFGLPGRNPYEGQTKAEGDEGHFLVVNISYANGSWKNIRVDITDVLRELPLGGVISLNLDVNDFPPEGGSSSGGDGFDALIDNWDEETGETTIIN
jgi:hypothetical protein